MKTYYIAVGFTIYGDCRAEELLNAGDPEPEETGGLPIPLGTYESQEEK